MIALVAIGLNFTQYGLFITCNGKESQASLPLK